MFDILFNPKKAERHPFEIFAISFAYCSVSILFSIWIFPQYASVSMVFLTVLATMYLVQGAIKKDEKRELPYKPEVWILKKHLPLVKLILFIFLGFVIAFIFWTLVLSPERISSLFSSQISAIGSVKSIVSTGSAVSNSGFMTILGNNLKVLLISLVFAIFYGAGAIYVLAWNASVMGFAIGNLARQTIGVISLPLIFMKYFVHGLPEMLAYLTAAIAGGLIYTAFIKGDFRLQGKAKKIFIDALVLVIISVALLVVAALIETNISPLI